MKAKITTKTAMLFCNNLRRIASEHGIQQKTIAKAFGVSRSAINKYFVGKSFPTPANIDKLADFFDIKISDLFKAPEEFEETSKQNEMKTLGDTSNSQALANMCRKVKNDVAFCIYVSTNTLSPSVQQGDLLVCDSYRFAQNTNTVLVLLEGELKLMKVCKSTGYYMLAPLDGLSENIIGTRAEVLAVIKEIRHPL